jgi:hypothetical protein
VIDGVERNNNVLKWEKNALQPSGSELLLKSSELPKKMM